jgi:hypothetical protein
MLPAIIPMVFLVGCALYGAYRMWMIGNWTLEMRDLKSAVIFGFVALLFYLFGVATGNPRIWWGGRGCSVAAQIYGQC